MKNSIVKTKRVAIIGIMSALSFVMMFLGNITGVLDLSAVVLCSVVSVFIMIEAGSSAALSMWGVVSVLSMLLLPDKSIALEYVLLGGIYPVVKSYAERVNLVVCWIAKLAYFNGMFTAFILLCRYVFAVEDLGFGLQLAAYAFGNVFFIIYDLCLTSIISLYIVKWRSKLRLPDIRSDKMKKAEEERRKAQRGK